jgi:flavin-dependent dehydrogenase
LVHRVFVETFEYGWGIVSYLNEHTNGMTLYTQKGSPIISQLKDYRNWKELLSNTKLLKDYLSDNLERKIVGGRANSSKSLQITGSNWLAIGDAAIAFDPLSSHGVSNAIYCANAASNAIESKLTNDTAIPFQNYDNTLCQIFNEYLKQKSNLHNTNNS